MPVSEACRRCPGAVYLRPDWGEDEPMGDLFDTPEQREREDQLYATLDQVAEKFGEGKLSLGLKK